MNPAFIYFREIPLKTNNKLKLDFSDEGFVQKLILLINYTKMKKITDCKIYSPFSHFKGKWI